MDWDAEIARTEREQQQAIRIRDQAVEAVLLLEGSLRTLRQLKAREQPAPSAEAPTAVADAAADGPTC